MHISYKPLWHTLLERDMRKEDLRLAAGMTTNMIANMSKEKHRKLEQSPAVFDELDDEESLLQAEIADPGEYPFVIVNPLAKLKCGRDQIGISAA